LREIGEPRPRSHDAVNKTVARMLSTFLGASLAL